tara:strand:+ start:322 stop:588 length:267 start_codon:yes stop_codon:yes gene_type:complete
MVQEDIDKVWEVDIGTEIDIDIDDLHKKDDDIYGITPDTGLMALVNADAQVLEMEIGDANIQGLDQMIAGLQMIVMGADIKKKYKYNI